MFNGLPEKSYAEHPEDMGKPMGERRLIKIERGMKGFIELWDMVSGGQEKAKELNAKIGVTPAQAEAMMIGSMFGWDVPGANPAVYDKNGILDKQIMATLATEAQLKNKVVWGLLLTDDSVFAAGPLTKQPGTVAYRIVLRKINGARPFVVHMERFPEFTVEHPDFKNPTYDGGQYFEVGELDKAIKAFGERVAANADYVRSLYRDENAGIP